MAVDIFRCDNDDVLNDCKVGDYVHAYFNENKKVVLFVPEVPSKEDIQPFIEVLGEAAALNIEE